MICSIADTAGGAVVVRQVNVPADSRASAALSGVDDPPIGGFTPLLAVGLTNEDTFDDFDWSAYNKSSPGAGTLPLGGSPHYEIGLFDTGSQGHFFHLDAIIAFNLAGAGLLGTHTTSLGGVGGSEEAYITDPLGVYVAGLDQVTGTAPLAVNTAALRGQFNVSVLEGQAGSSLPNVIGTPMASQYTAFIRNDQPQILNTGGATWRSPSVELLPLGTVPDPANVRHAFMTLEPADIFQSPPTFFPSFDNFDDLHDNPFIPTASGGFFLSVDLANQGMTRDNQAFLLDTGAQITVVSRPNAVNLGFDPAVDTPDFTIEISGGGGAVVDVPGIIIDSLNIDTEGGTFTLNNVPVVVLNLLDPRDGVNTLPGIIGMNLFTDRNLVVNPQPGDAYLAISDPVLQTHTWSSAAPSEIWATADNWSAAGEPAPLWVASLRNVTAVDQEAVVAADSTVNRILVGGDTATMTLAIDPGVTLTVFGAVDAADLGRIELRGGALSAQNVQVRGGVLAGAGTVAADVDSAAVVSPGLSPGVLNIQGNYRQDENGRLVIELAGDDNGGAAPQFDQLVITGRASLAGTLQIDRVGGFVPIPFQQFDVVTFSERFGQFDLVEFDNADVPGLSILVQYLDDAVVLHPEALAGDIDFNGIVDLADLAMLAPHFGQVAGVNWLDGDFNNDGAVDFADLSLMSPHIAMSAPELAARLSSIPEPTTLAIITASGALLLARRRRRFGQP